MTRQNLDSTITSTHTTAAASASRAPPGNATHPGEKHEEENAEAHPSGQTGRGATELIQDQRTPIAATRDYTAAATPGSTRRILGRTPPDSEGAKQRINLTPSTPEEQRMFDDDAVPATRDEFRRLRRQLKETRMYVQDLQQQQQQTAEDADTWIRVARKAAETARKEAKEARREVNERVQDITEVFRVQRDLIDDLRTEMD